MLSSLVGQAVALSITYILGCCFKLMRPEVDVGLEKLLRQNLGV